MTGAALAIESIGRLLAATIATIEAEFAALPDADASWRPAPGEWCAKEVLGHLIEAERRGFAGRIAEILASDGPTFQTWDQPAVAAARGDCERDGAALVAEFVGLRLQSLELVGGLGLADLDRVGRHPTVGELSIGDVLGEWVHHDRNHVRQILANVQARVWPQMGAARRFSDPNA